MIIIKSVRTEQIGSKRFKLYTTSIGEITHSELAKILGIIPSELSKRIRKYGLTSPKTAKKYDIKSSRRGNWEGLSGKKREGNLKKLKNATMSHYLNALKNK